MASLTVCISEELKSKMDDKYKLFADLSKKTPGIDTENNPNRKPDWLDEQLMVNARWLAKKYFASLFLAHFAGLLLLFQMETLLVPVFATTSHNTIEKLFKRYLDTFVHIKKWYSGDIFDKNSDGCRSIKKVNLMHRQVYKSVNQSVKTRPRCT
ncbi:hypothetical protein HDE_03541 [Halotydeus destructor]|nr:hypothetical protein HDE_03541 [Halotydeus destructor]